MTDDLIIKYLSALTRSLSIPETAELLGVSSDTVARRVRDGLIGYRRDGKRIVFSPSPVIDYILARTYTPPVMAAK
jgi:excisionase family DNA binding protein